MNRIQNVLRIIWEFMNAKEERGSSAGIKY
jgi:hypothetical protein